MRSVDNTLLEQASLQFAADIRLWIAAEGSRQTEIIGPAPCFFSRVAGQYRWQIIVRGPNPVSLFRGREIGAWRLEVNPPSLL
jgi:primosomal protein N' (replication factor Y)